eukprot:CAMPEP_0174325622 /NCGR_PEP_ID=MMETSP0810-20121108/13357_1 /TAXON_ID=73025 ORGANISM="Eutreptiella gymnastica-like, Strain CCMP1594" /NCGR_SAMPLE_ID=MMETSP0810 /ASSEMBLY_ACC=CAM_ASM_000659 /LENGTH=154 /DNA_ID=CAMNT_0015438965 /DNA_START=1162 /DNA_END=1624 /DNA_ORIENTATION=-
MAVAVPGLVAVEPPSRTSLLIIVSVQDSFIMDLGLAWAVNQIYDLASFKTSSICTASACDDATNTLRPRRSNFWPEEGSKITPPASSMSNLPPAKSQILMPAADPHSPSSKNASTFPEATAAMFKPQDPAMRTLRTLRRINPAKELVILVMDAS